MLRKLAIGALGAIAVFFSTTAFAQGTAAEAKAMLARQQMLPSFATQGVEVDDKPMEA